MAAKKIYLIGIDGNALLFYNAEPISVVDGLSGAPNGYILQRSYGGSSLGSISLIAHLTRPNDWKPIDNSPLAQLILSPSEDQAEEWRKLLIEKDQATIAKYTKQAPKPIELPPSMPAEHDAALRKAGIAVAGPRRVVKRSTPKPEPEEQYEPE